MRKTMRWNAAAAAESVGSEVVVQEELVRHGAQAHRIDLALALVLHPGLEQIAGEDVAAEQELVVLLERGERVVEAARHVRDLLQLLGGERVDVLVERVARIDAV